MRFGRSLTFGVFALLLSVCSISQAALIGWYFEGEFTTFGTDYANAGLSVGDKLYGGVLFSTSAPDVYPADPVTGAYAAIFSFVSVPTLGSLWSFAGPNNTQRVVVQNDVPQAPPYDLFEIFMRNTSFDTVLPNPTRQFFLTGKASTGLFANDSLPVNPPDVAAFAFLNFQYTDLSIVEGASASGVITRIMQVPEPCSLALLGLGLAGLVSIRRRKQ